RKGAEYTTMLCIRAKPRASGQYLRSGQTSTACTRCALLRPRLQALHDLPPEPLDGVSIHGRLVRSGHQFGFDLGSEGIERHADRMPVVLVGTPLATALQWHADRHQRSVLSGMAPRSTMQRTYRASRQCQQYDASPDTLHEGRLVATLGQPVQAQRKSQPRILGEGDVQAGVAADVIARLECEHSVPGAEAVGIRDVSRCKRHESRDRIEDGITYRRIAGSIGTAALENKMTTRVDAVHFDRVVRPLRVPRNHRLAGLHVETDKLRIREHLVRISTGCPVNGAGVLITGRWRCPGFTGLFAQ